VKIQTEADLIRLLSDVQDKLFSQKNEIDRLRGVLAETAEIFNKLRMHDNAGRIDAALADGEGVGK